jgi:hypothetical protein
MKVGCLLIFVLALFLDLESNALPAHRQPRGTGPRQRRSLELNAFSQPNSTALKIIGGMCVSLGIVWFFSSPIYNTAADIPTLFFKESREISAGMFIVYL